jgi:hypothetical protein
MKKSGLLTLVLLFFLIPLSKIEAKLTIISPQEMVEQSSLIIIGTVTKKEYTEEKRLVSISVETVVKGKSQQKEIQLKRDKPLMYGWLGFDFPETGSRVMLLLQQNDQLTLTGDVNAVSVLDDSNFRLYKGTTMGKWAPEQYEKSYKAYLDKQSSQMSDKMNENGVTITPSTETKQQTFNTLINKILILGGFVVTMFLIYRILKRKRQN